MPNHYFIPDWHMPTVSPAEASKAIKEGQRIMQAISECDFQDSSQVESLVQKYPHLKDFLVNYVETGDT